MSCCAMPCRVVLADMLYESVLTRHGMARHCFFSCVNASERKWAMLVGKNLHLVPSSFASFEDFVQKAMATIWNDMETFKLVKIWGEGEIQAHLEGCTRNKAVYEIDCLCRNLAA